MMFSATFCYFCAILGSSVTPDSSLFRKKDTCRMIGKKSKQMVSLYAGGVGYNPFSYGYLIEWRFFFPFEGVL